MNILNVKTLKNFGIYNAFHCIYEPLYIYEPLPKTDYQDGTKISHGKFQVSILGNDHINLIVCAESK